MRNLRVWADVGNAEEGRASRARDAEVDFEVREQQRRRGRATLGDVARVVIVRRCGSGAGTDDLRNEAATAGMQAAAEVGCGDGGAVPTGRELTVQFATPVHRAARSSIACSLGS